jgi:hypothetical protein
MHRSCGYLVLLTSSLAAAPAFAQAEPTSVRFFCITDDMVGWHMNPETQSEFVGRIQPTRENERFLVAFYAPTAVTSPDSLPPMNLPRVESEAFGLRPLFQVPALELLYMRRFEAGSDFMGFEGMRISNSDSEGISGVYTHSYGGQTFYLDRNMTRTGSVYPFEWLQSSLYPSFTYLARGRCERIDGE